MYIYMYMLYLYMQSHITLQNIEKEAHVHCQFTLSYTCVRVCIHESAWAPFLSLPFPSALLSSLLPSGPDIDTPEEKKKKQELALAKQAEEQEQMVAMATGVISNQPSSTSVSIPNHTPPSQRRHASSFSGHEQPDRSGANTGPYQHSRHAGRPAGPNHHHGEDNNHVNTNVCIYVLCILWIYAFYRMRKHNYGAHSVDCVDQ